MRFAASKAGRRGERVVNEAPPLAVLVIGYGNALRRDDGAGVAVAARLGRHFHKNARCGFETMHQLTPDIAEDIARARRVIFVDATVEARPGKVLVRRVKETAADCSLGHHLSPEAVMAMVYGLYGVRPRAWVVGVGASDLGMGDRLSPMVRRAAERLHVRLRHVIARWSGNCGRCGKAKE